MGGPGSGMWYRWDTRTTLDQVNRLDVRWLHRQGYLDGWPQGVTWSPRRASDRLCRYRVMDGCLVVEYRCRRAWNGPLGRHPASHHPGLDTLSLWWPAALVSVSALSAACSCVVS